MSDNPTRGNLPTIGPSDYRTRSPRLDKTGFLLQVTPKPVPGEPPVHRLPEMPELKDFTPQDSAAAAIINETGYRPAFTSHRFEIDSGGADDSVQFFLSRVTLGDRRPRT